jgi:hypothetical protein
MGDRESSEMSNSSIIYLKHCKNLCKCCNVPTPSTTITKIETILKITKWKI